MTTRLSLRYNEHLFKSDGPCKGKLQAKKQKADLKKLKEELRISKSLHRVYRKAAVGALAELKVQIAQLQEDLAEEKQNALDQLQDRAEVVGDLQKRAAPEGWDIRGLFQKEGKGETLVTKHVAFSIASNLWRWSVYRFLSVDKSGSCATLAEAVKAAEAVKLPKVKLLRKARRK
jgi:hypothetical protein